MRASNLRLITGADGCELRADVTSPSLEQPFSLWYRFPSHFADLLDPRAGDSLMAALLLPAMCTGETLEIEAPVSPVLRRATSEIQAIYHRWNPNLQIVQVAAPAKEQIPSVGRQTGMFFSSGADSFYTLLKNVTETPTNGAGERLKHLILVHGFDIAVGKWNSSVFDQLLHNTGTSPPS